MHLLPRMNVLLDFICIGPVDLPGARQKRQKYKIIAHSGARTNNLEICSLMLYRMNSPSKYKHTKYKYKIQMKSSMTFIRDNRYIERMMI